MELQRHTGWIIDRFHLSTCQYQLQHFRAEYDFDWLEERLKKLCFHQVLVTQEPEALQQAISQGHKTPLPGELERVLQQQNLLRQLASASMLPTMEIVVSQNDAQSTADKIADWIESVGGNIPPDDYAIEGVILPKVC